MAAVSGQLKLLLARLHDSYENVISVLICSKSMASYESYFAQASLSHKRRPGRKRMIQCTTTVSYPHREVSLANLKAWGLEPEEFEAEKMGFLLSLKRCLAESCKALATLNSNPGSPPCNWSFCRAICQIDTTAFPPCNNIFGFFDATLPVKALSHTAVSQTEEAARKWNWNCVVECCQRLGKNVNMAGHAFKKIVSSGSFAPSGSCCVGSAP